MGNWREVWVEHNGSIPKGHHIHHILPRSEGGLDNIENLKCVTPEEHYDIHFDRGDYGACALISDGIDREAPTMSVRQYDLSGNFIKEWDSFSDITASYRKIGKGKGLPGNVVSCCKYNKKSYNNFQWFYKSEVGDLDFVGSVERKANRGGNSGKPIRILDVKTGKIYNSKRAAALVVHGKHTDIRGKKYRDRLKII